MKALILVAWIAGILAGVLVLMGTISFFFKLQLLGINHAVNYFHAANSYLLVAICSLLLKRTLKQP
jgi:hypothetical protein